MATSVPFTIAKRLTCVVLVCACVVSALSCNREPDNVPARPPGPVVPLFSGDLGPDGSLNESGLKKLQSHSQDPSITIEFVHCDLSDKGLEQLSAFPNIRRIEASGTQITEAGIAKLKQANPKVEVAK
jgi:hypothetical protein